MLIIIQSVLERNELRASMLTTATDDHWKFLRTVISSFYSLKQMREVCMNKSILKNNFRNLIIIYDLY